MSEIKNMLIEIKKDIEDLRKEQKLNFAELRMEIKMINVSMSMVSKRMDMVELIQKNNLSISQELSQPYSDIRYAGVHPFNSFRTTRRKRVLAL